LGISLALGAGMGSPLGWVAGAIMGAPEEPQEPSAQPPQEPQEPLAQLLQPHSMDSQPHSLCRRILAFRRAQNPSLQGASHSQEAVQAPHEPQLVQDSSAPLWCQPHLDPHSQAAGAQVSQVVSQPHSLCLPQCHLCLPHSSAQAPQAPQVSQVPHPMPQSPPPQDEQVEAAMGAIA
jgi:hypothetical protein